MKEQPLRWGFLSTANIARKNWKAIRNSGNGVVAAVASRDAARSQQFIDECQAEVPFPSTPRAFGSYQELLDSHEVDAVYVPLPTGLRKEWVLRAAKAGKHVVCEKPCGVGVEDVREMIEACRKNGVQFMDGVMFMHSGRLDCVREVLSDGASVGRLKRFASQFSFRAPEDFLTGNIRMHSDLEPHGCLGDLGWYNLRFFLWAMNWEMPRKVMGRLLSASGRDDSPESVPTEFSGELIFDRGVSAGFYCSFLTENQGWMHVSGDRGYMRIEDFVLPFFGNELEFEVNNSVFQVKGCEFNMERHARRFAVSEYSNSHENAQETKLFRNFVRQVRSGKLNADWPEFALKTQRVMNACLESAREGGKLVTLS